MMSKISQLLIAALNKRLTQHLDKIGFLKWNQNGFRTEHSNLD